MQRCRVCGSTEFFKEAGFYFCQTCQTQNEDIREEVLEIRIDPKTRLRRTRIRDSKSDKIESDVIGWTSWELYNFILIGLTNELMELGITSDIKLTVLQLWATYLGKLEVAFTSTTRRCIPKLARRFNKRDAEIIYGKVKVQRKRRRRKKTGSSATDSLISGFQSDCSSIRELNKTKKLMATADYKRFMESQGSSEGDTLSLHNQSVYSVQSSSLSSVISTRSTKSRVKFSTHAKKEAEKVSKLSKKLPRCERGKYKKKHITVQYRSGPHLITPMRLWAILYLALRIHQQPIHLGDMLRYGREGHLSYYKLEHLLPPEVSLTKHDINLLSQNMEITHKGMRRLIASIAKYLGVWELVCPDFFPLISRYCEELELPRGILLYVERLIALSPPKMVFNKSKACLPNYEGRAMAFIIVVLKLLFGLDGITEYKISNVADKINRIEENGCFSIDISGPCIIVHGGAADRNDSVVIEKLMSCKKAASNGYAQLIRGKSAIDAVEAALWWLECDEFFNCGYGSVLNDIGDVQMDACIIDGSKFKCGSIAAVTDVEHPISFAKYILEHFPNTIVVGTDAELLAKQANINWLSKNSMVSPAARLAFESDNMKECRIDVNPGIVECVKMLKNSYGTAGCIAWDGHRIAAGTTTGGRNKKMPGSLGSSPIFGCGSFANATIGCSLTGHAESILKLNSARKISEDIKNGCTPHEVLKENIDEMLDKLGHTGGGIVLEKNGSWAVYFTSETMPYAIIKDDWITFGTELNERKTELYRACHAEFRNNALASERGILDAKLFNFREWQRYLECRKAFLIDLHLPTKLKYAPHVPRVNSLYIKFLENIHSKNEREEPEMTNYKHHLPRDLANAMKQCIYNLNQDNVPLKEADFFAPSLTPLHSYIQQLTDHPLHELPSFLRRSFFATKIGYMTKPESLVQLASQCNIDLTVIDTNLHFIEKIVPHYEPLKMPSVKELKEIVKIQKVADDATCTNSENINDYLHKKIPCLINIDEEKRIYYDAVQESAKNCEDFKDDFGYGNVLPNGKLLIPNDSDSESDDDDADHKDLKDNNVKLLDAKFCMKYNLHLSQCEKESLCCKDIGNRVFKQSSKPVLIRNSKGQFVKSTDIPNDSSNVDRPKVGKKKQTKKKEQPKDEEKDIFLTERDASDAGSSRDEDILDLSNISSFEDDYTNHVDMKFHDITDTARESGNFFRPFKDYWMYHCVFSRVKPKNFELFEKSLPVNFRWLLNECAQTVEMSSCDLYEEVCLIESYFTYVLKPDSIKTDNKYKTIDPKSKAFRNSILNKW